MRKSIALKTLLRAPLKTLLTFLLIAAASFALFSRVTDYAVTTREAARAEEFYHGVAALDNTVPPISSEEGIIYVDDKSWPADEKIEEFASLPGVTLVDKRYMTAGLVEDYKRLPVDKDYTPYYTGEFVVEGTYSGYEDGGSGTRIDLLLDDVTVLAGDIALDSGKPLRIMTAAIEVEDSEAVLDYGEKSRSFYDGLDKGTRCLVMGSYNETTGRTLETSDWSKENFWILDGLGEDYLETEEFTYQKGVVEAAGLDLYTYDIAYTSDMRAIPRFNDRSMSIAEGRLLTAGDTDACVVNELFLEKNHLSIGDRISIKLGDRLRHQDAWFGTRALVGKNIPNFVSTVELEIVGAYRFNDDFMARDSEDVWSYTSSTVFVPVSLLPVEVPKDYEPIAGEFSVFVEDAHDIEAFREDAEPLAAEMGLGLRFSDGGWMSVKDSFETGRQASFLTAVLYVLGVVLALYLAVYFYIGRNKKLYAIMRTLGVPGKKAGNAVVLPLVMLSALAMSVGGIIGLFYTSRTAAKVFADMAVNVSENYVSNTALPAGTVILCLAFEWTFLLLATLFFLWKMKKIPPLELLQEGTRRVGIGGKEVSAPKESTSVPIAFDVTKIPVADVKLEGKIPTRRKYNAVHQVSSYILRHIRRGIGKAAVSLILAAVLAAGVGVFALAKAAYRDAFHEVDVKGRATGFSSASIEELSKSDLMDEVYYYNKFSVRVNDVGLSSPMTLTNDFGRYLVNDYTVTYAEGYDSSVFDGTGPVCLLGQELAKELDIRLGGEITMLADELYTFMMGLYEDEESFRAAVERAGKAYKVVGILESGDEEVSSGIFAAANSAAEILYGQPFPVGYCEFTLTDNGRLVELNALLDEQKKQGMEYAPMASFYIDAAGLENTRRVRDLLESLFPIAVAAAVLIGLFGSGLVIMQLAKEAAFLRILGVTKKRARCMLVLEQIFLCIIGIGFVADILALFESGGFAKSMGTLAVCWLLYLLGCVCGTAVAAAQVTGGRILELLQVKE